MPVAPVPNQPPPSGLEPAAPGYAPPHRARASSQGANAPEGEGGGGGPAAGGGAAGGGCVLPAGPETERGRLAGLPVTPKTEGPAGRVRPLEDGGGPEPRESIHFQCCLLSGFPFLWVPAINTYTGIGLAFCSALKLFWGEKRSRGVF